MFFVKSVYTVFAKYPIREWYTYSTYVEKRVTITSLMKCLFDLQKLCISKQLNMYVYSMFICLVQ